MVLGIRYLEVQRIGGCSCGDPCSQLSLWRRHLGSGSSLGSLDGLKEAPSVSFLDISPAKAGGESPSLRGRRGQNDPYPRVLLVLGGSVDGKHSVLRSQHFGCT
jgi:hypothetical protein